MTKPSLCCGKRLRANPKDDQRRDDAIHVLINARKLDEAASHLNDFLARNPKNQEAWYLLGKTYLQLSENALKKINEIDPDSVVAHEIAGEIDESMHNYDLALVEYKKAVDWRPKRRVPTCTWATRTGTSANGSRRRRSSRPNWPTIQNNCMAHWKLANCDTRGQRFQRRSLAELNTLHRTLPHAHAGPCRSCARPREAGQAAGSLA